MAKTTPTSHLVGDTKYKRKRRFPPGSGTAGNNHGRPPQLITYCPECPIPSLADPEKAVRVGVSEKKRLARCPNGHIWLIR